ncbi:hypothetical protein ACVGOW_27415 [Pseudonocardia saturnea]
MPFFRRGGNRSEPNAPTPPVGLPVDLHSGVLNAIGRELNVVLPESALRDLRAATAALTSGVTDAVEHERALVALDWVNRTWFATWCRIVPDTGDTLAAKLSGCSPIQDDDTAAAVGNFVALMAGAPEQNAEFLKQNYDRNDRFEGIALGAAESASSDALRQSAGPAIADVIAPQALREYRAAQTDVALAAIASLSMAHSLDEVWPFIVHHLNLPGEIDVKAISIRNLAPYAAARPLEPIVAKLQASVADLYVDLAKMG